MRSTFFKNISATFFCILLVHAIEFTDKVEVKIPGRSQSVKFTLPNDFGYLESWNITEGIHINSTSNFVFETINSLLQHWPNTRYRNGHTLVPATIPRGTVLYHGTTQAEIPTVPEWLAMNPEHSYQFCGQSKIIPPLAPPGSRMTGNNCWHLTMVTIRPLNLLYFDGSSAAKMDGGPLDSQDLLAWGEIRQDMIFQERERINKLCEWGSRYELDGFVRMEMDFEVMLCNFTKGLEPVSFLNLRYTPDDKPRGPKSPSGSLRRTRTVQAGSWANRFPGELRIKLDYSRLISFYDEGLFPSLHAKRIGLERWDHRLQAITKKDIETLFARMDNIFSTNSTASTSGIEWQTLLHVMTDRYAERLELLSYILNSTVLGTSTDQVLQKAHRYVSSMLMAYTPYDVVPPKNRTGIGSHIWATPVFRQCATTHTKYHLALSESLSASEKLLLKAVHDVSKEICRVLVSIWAEGEESWGAAATGYDPESTDQNPKQESYDVMKTQRMLAGWSASIANLMKWLDWNVWVRCQPECDYEEMCYLPTWPYFFRPFDDRPGYPYPTEILEGQMSQPKDYLEEEWRRPKPKCVRRVEPYIL